MANSPNTPKQAPEPTLTGEQVAEMRAEGATWKQVAEAAGLPDGASIIPLRNAMYKAQGKQTKAKSKKQLGQEIVKLRDAGQGWPRIAAATGLSIPDAKTAYTAAGGANPDGRVYIKQATKEGEEPTVTVRTEPTKPATAVEAEPKTEQSEPSEPSEQGGEQPAA